MRIVQGDAFEVWKDNEHTVLLVPIAAETTRRGETFLPPELEDGLRYKLPALPRKAGTVFERLGFKAIYLAGDWRVLLFPVRLERNDHVDPDLVAKSVAEMMQNETLRDLVIVSPTIGGKKTWEKKIKNLFKDTPVVFYEKPTVAKKAKIVETSLAPDASPESTFEGILPFIKPNGGEINEGEIVDFDVREPLTDEEALRLFTPRSVDAEGNETLPKETSVEKGEDGWLTITSVFKAPDDDDDTE